MSQLVGGLVGHNASTGSNSRHDYVAVISASYATGVVEGSGSRSVGGLVGFNGYRSSRIPFRTPIPTVISASYATGNVTGTVTTSDAEGSQDGGVGGLVGSNSLSAISVSYATGSVNGTVTTSDAEGSQDGGVGGLAGRNSRGIRNSFWDTQTSGQPAGSGVGSGASTGLLGRTTAQLQAPTGYTGIYRNWDDVDRWDFGTSSQYPVLKVDFDGNGTVTWQEFGSQRGDIVTLPGAPTGLTATANGQTQIDLSWSAPASDGGAAITGYRIEVSADGSAWSHLDADTGSTTTSYSHTGLTAGTTRHYRVSAITSAGTGPESNVASATTTLGDSLVDRYNANGNNMIDKAEVIEAINDYLFGAGDEAISKAEVIELINLYLFG